MGKDTDLNWYVYDGCRCAGSDTRVAVLATCAEDADDFINMHFVKARRLDLGVFPATADSIEIDGVGLYGIADMALALCPDVAIGAVTSKRTELADRFLLAVIGATLILILAIDVIAMLTM